MYPYKGETITLYLEEQNFKKISKKKKKIDTTLWLGGAVLQSQGLVPPPYILTSIYIEAFYVSK
jgi:hypothetical protein